MSSAEAVGEGSGVPGESRREAAGTSWAGRRPLVLLLGVGTPSCDYNSNDGKIKFICKCFEAK